MSWYSFIKSNLESDNAETMEDNLETQFDKACLIFIYYLLKHFLQQHSNEKELLPRRLQGVQKILKLLETRGFPYSKIESSAHGRGWNVSLCFFRFPSMSFNFNNKAPLYIYTHTYIALSSIIFVMYKGFQPRGVLHICTTSPRKKPNQMVGVILDM